MLGREDSWQELDSLRKGLWVLFYSAFDYEVSYRVRLRKETAYTSCSQTIMAHTDSSTTYLHTAYMLHAQFSPLWKGIENYKRKVIPINRVLHKAPDVQS